MPYLLQRLRPALSGPSFWTGLTRKILQIDNIMTSRPRNFRCDRCDMAFESNRNLQRHRARKTPCDPIMDVSPNSSQSTTCRYCGREYSRPDNLARHLKTCKIANSDEGMEKLLDHTLRRQVAALQEQHASVAALVSGGALPAPSSCWPISNSGARSIAMRGTRRYAALMPQRDTP